MRKFTCRQPAQVQITCPAGHSMFTSMVLHLFLVSCIVSCFYKYRDTMNERCLFPCIVRAKTYFASRGFQTFNDVKYATIQMDVLPDTAIDSVGTRWDTTYFLRHILRDCDSESSCQACEDCLLRSSSLTECDEKSGKEV